MTIATELALLANTKESLRVAIGLSTSIPFSQYASYLSWNPIKLFKNGEQGAWYDPSDLSTLFQDAAGTTPVTADGDPVGLMLDKSGNVSHAIQSVAASRPVYRTDGTLHWLQFDGVDDHLNVPDNPSLRQTQMSFVFSYLSTAQHLQIILSNGDGRAFNTNNWLVGVDSSLVVLPRTPTVLWVAPSSINKTHVGSVVADGVTINGRLDGGGETSLTGTFGTDNTTGFTLGAQASIPHELFLSGNMFGAVIVAGRSISSAERNNTERYLAEKSGVTL